MLRCADFCAEETQIRDIAILPKGKEKPIFVTSEMCERNEESHFRDKRNVDFKDSANLLINHRLILGMHRLMGLMDGQLGWMGRMDEWTDGWH